MGRKAQVMVHVHQFCGAGHGGVHLLLGHAVVFQREGDVLGHRQADELAVRVLQHRAHRFGQRKDALLLRLHAVHRQSAGGFAGVAEGDEPVDAAGQGGFARAGGPGDQNLFAGIDVQVDVVEGGPGLGAVLEGEIPEGNDGVHRQRSSQFKNQRKRGQGTALPPMQNAPKRLAAQAFRRAKCRRKELTPCPASPSWRWSCRKQPPAGRPR